VARIASHRGNGGRADSALDREATGGTDEPRANADLDKRFERRSWRLRFPFAAGGEMFSKLYHLLLRHDLAWRESNRHLDGVQRSLPPQLRK
jgi:hypothetical protein